MAKAKLIPELMLNFGDKRFTRKVSGKIGKGTSFAIMKSGVQDTIHTIHYDKDGNKIGEMTVMDGQVVEETGVPIDDPSVDSVHVSAETTVSR